MTLGSRMGVVAATSSLNSSGATRFTTEIGRVSSSENAKRRDSCRCRRPESTSHENPIANARSAAPAPSQIAARGPACAAT